jgi:hypothetical protein
LAVVIKKETVPKDLLGKSKPEQQAYEEGQKYIGKKIRFYRLN